MAGLLHTHRRRSFLAIQRARRRQPFWKGDCCGNERMAPGAERRPSRILAQRDDLSAVNGFVNTGDWLLRCRHEVDHHRSLEADACTTSSAIYATSPGKVGLLFCWWRICFTSVPSGSAGAVPSLRVLG